MPKTTYVIPADSPHCARIAKAAARHQARSQYRTATGTFERQEDLRHLDAVIAAATKLREVLQEEAANK